MRRLRLKSATVAVFSEPDGKSTAVMIPEVADIAIDEHDLEGRGFRGLVPVEWKGKLLRVFWVDLQERGESLEPAADRAIGQLFRGPV